MRNLGISETAGKVIEQFKPDLKHFQPVTTDWNGLGMQHNGTLGTKCDKKTMEQRWNGLDRMEWFEMK